MNKLILLTALICSIASANNVDTSHNYKNLLQEQQYLKSLTKDSETRPGEDCEDPKPRPEPIPRENPDTKVEEEGTGGNCKPH